MIGDSPARWRGSALVAADTPVPDGPAALTREWFSLALSGGALLRDDAVATVRIERLSGDGFVGEIFRCHLAFEPSGRRPTLIAKLPCADRQRRALLDAFSVQEREVRYYSELADDAGIAVPRCHVASRAPHTGDAVVLLDDLSPLATADPIAGCSLGQADSAIDAIARMHARWWGEQRLAALGWLPPPASERMRDLAAKAYPAAWSAFAAAFGAHLPAEVRRLGERLHDDLPLVLDRLSAPPRTLVHGDYQGSNIFFDATDALRAVIDWQVPMQARGPVDLAWFLSSSLDPPLRRQAEARLIRRYHEVLQSAGVANYSREECGSDYRLALLLRLAFAVLITHALSPSGAEAPDPRRDAIAAVGGARLVAALVDARAAEVLPRRRWWGRLRAARISRAHVVPSPATLESRRDAIDG